MTDYIYIQSVLSKFQKENFEEYLIKMNQNLAIKIL